MKFNLFTDGASRNNPGPAGIGGYIVDDTGRIAAEFKDFIGIATNNVAEYTALIEGIMLALEKGITELTCSLDSELVVKQMKGEYRVKDNNLKILHSKAKELSKNFQIVNFKHVPREENKMADKLVNEALDAVS